ncbi:MAG: tRNA (adenosine(37)-N6)-dimethylallyltransferase MiaA [Gammaproteobacteria bacterium]
MGPTASGKTELAVTLVQHFPMDIISVDSALVYKGMDIGSAKPAPEVLARAPHRLIDFIDPAEPYSAARFREDALREIEAIVAQGRIPLLVGGTMLYFRALLEGLSVLPSADDAVRARLEAEAREKGWPALHARLAEVDPQAAQRIHATDPQRIQRALEVYELSGIPLSQWQQQAERPAALPYRVIKLALIPSDRQYLHALIARRFQRMLDDGFVDEVRRLYARADLDPSKPAIRAVGYRQVWEYLCGNLSYEEMVERGIIATRQLAKRQHTWLRSEQNLRVFDSLSADVHEQVLNYLRTALMSSS